ncbi:hypothetical protein Pla175_29790 [Pirellulimonas nuda]|uniref:Carboxypeptidase regulatory-like domain-containing protein n=1 Tax=Pirellulimonas nuda TaxID=2528009 RepID=A0A518DDN7_9BACT|nr:hypothetical protein [Pirellulimonas nuda]QDU89587.1 hypothetical protein Pla175_29790 [Pirellulimonas nuda]
MTSLQRTLVLIATLPLTVGCGGPPPPPIVPAGGVVTLNGQPLPMAQVRFIPQIDQGAGYIATGVTDQEGRYELTCDGEPGACAAATSITVSEGDAPPELMGENAQRELAVYRKSLKNRPIPTGYASPVSSPLTAEVTADQAQYDLELTR